MQVSVRQHEAGFEIMTVSAGPNVFELSTYGGQLLSWTQGDIAIMFANREHAILDGVAAYRGGAPVCFPYFSKGTLMPGNPTLLPQHGRARNSIWSAEIDETLDTVRLSTVQPTAEGFGPTSFACTLAYRFGDDLEITAEVTNVGSHAAPFQLAIHSYWATEAPDDARVDGLGEAFLDNLQGYATATDPADNAPHTPPFDRVYPDAAAHLRLETERYILRVETENCPGAVLWNPGPNHPIADLGKPDFICLESGMIYPARELAPEETTRLRIRYQIQDPSGD